MDESGPKLASEVEKKSTTRAKVTSTNDNMSKLSIADLQKMLEEVLDKEDYIKAAQIRDEINSRKL
jgi:protein-arginine kinase activator protein McsA